MRGDMRRGTYWVPGDPRTYVLPQDIEALDAAWDRYAGGKTAPDDVEPDSRGEVDMSPEAVEARRLAKARRDEAMAFIASYTGTFGLILDLRSDHRWGTKHMRLSERQVDAVLASRDRDAARDLERELWQDDVYNHHLSMENDDARPTTGEAPGLASQPTPGTPARGDVSDGWYVVDGEPWKVQWNRERTRKYAKRLVVDPDRGGPGADRDAGHHPAAGDWQYVPGGLGIVAARGEPMTLEVAQQYGKLYGVCAICGRTLTDETSIADGIGPVCKERVG